MSMIKLTQRNSDHPLYVKADAILMISTVYVSATEDTTQVLLGRSLFYDVKETPEEILALMNPPYDPRPHYITRLT